MLMNLLAVSRKKEQKEKEEREGEYSKCKVSKHVEEPRGVITTSKFTTPLVGEKESTTCVLFWTRSTPGGGVGCELGAGVGVGRRRTSFVKEKISEKSVK